MTKKLLYIDMDGVIVDFESAFEQLDQVVRDDYFTTVWSVLEAWREDPCFRW